MRLPWGVFPPFIAVSQPFSCAYLHPDLFNHDPTPSCKTDIYRSAGDCGLADCILPPCTCYSSVFARILDPHCSQCLPRTLPSLLVPLSPMRHRNYSSCRSLFFSFGTHSSLAVPSKEECSGFNPSVVIVVKESSGFLSRLLSICKHVQNLLPAFDLFMHFVFLLNDEMMWIPGPSSFIVYWTATVLWHLLGKKATWPDNNEKHNQMLGITLRAGQNVSSLFIQIKRSHAWKINVSMEPERHKLFITNISLF